MQEWLARQTAETGSEMTDRRLRAICSYNDLPEFSKATPHIHPGLEVGIVLSGRELVDFPDRSRECAEGDVWLCGMWEPHGWQLPDAGTSTVVLIFPPDFVGTEMVCGVPWLTLFALPLGDRLAPKSLAVRRQVVEIGQTMRSEIQRGEPYWEQVVRLELLRLLTVLTRHLRTAGEERLARTKRLSGLAQLMPAFGLVHSDISRRVDVKEAAAACGMSPSRFHTVFRETMNTTFGQFALRSRLYFAADRLVNTNDTIASIAVEAGFTDDSHLHHCFKQEYSCTPGEYRARAHAMRQRATRNGVRFAEGVEFRGEETAVQE